MLQNIIVGHAIHSSFIVANMWHCGSKKPEDNIGGSVGEDFNMEKTPAAHVSRSLLEGSRCLEKIRQDTCEGRKSKTLEQLNLASAFPDFPP